MKEHGSKLLSIEEIELLKELCVLNEPRILSSDILNVIEFSDDMKLIGEALYFDLEARSKQYFFNIMFVTASFMDQRYKRIRFIK